MTLDAKIKRLKAKRVAPEVIELLEHLIEQSQKQACEGYLQALERLPRDLKTLQNDNRLFLATIISVWLSALIVLGVAVYYG